MHDQSQSEQRRELPGQIRSARDYVREMIRYGVLPVDHDSDASVDPFDNGQGVLENVLVRTESPVAEIEHQVLEAGDADPGGNAIAGFGQSAGGQP